MARRKINPATEVRALIVLKEWIYGANPKATRQRRRDVEALLNNYMDMSERLKEKAK